jgi:hypothetical protein
MVMVTMVMVAMMDGEGYATTMRIRNAMGG